MLAQVQQKTLLLACCSALILLPCSTAPDAYDRHHAGSADSIVAGMRRALSDEIRLWYPLCMDTVCGGFFSDIDYRWELKGDQNKMIVTQARHIWAAANAATFLPEKAMLRRVAAHGMIFLRNHLWDSEYGGFYDLVDRRGIPIHEDGKIVKRAYGNAFAIYGLSRAFHAFGDSSALRLAQDTFRWLEEHSYDSLHGGYFQFMSREGKPFLEGYGRTPPKDQNSSIHLLECLTELYRVWKDPLVSERLHRMLRLIRDTLTTERGYLRLFFRRDWSPVTSSDSGTEAREWNYEFDHVSFGHDIETAYLMLEASEALGFKRDTVTLMAAKKMVDHALRYGMDGERGGLFDGGYYRPGEAHPSIVKRSKEWWAQAEALNSLLMMSELFPDDTLRYGEKFRNQWDYCIKYVIDPRYGGWYWGGVDVVPANRYAPKGTIWKGNYHTTRALINCIRTLEK